MQPHTSTAHAKPRVAVPSDDSSGGKIPHRQTPTTAAAPKAFQRDAEIRDPASLAAALRDKDRQLGEKEAHLKMLRSRLEMAERDGETARRRLEASQIEREREKERERNAAAGAAFSAANADGGVAINPRGHHDHAPYGQHDTAFQTSAAQRAQRNANLDFRSREDGPNPMDVSNAAALQEARAELARLRARVAFKDEEAEEARRREDEHRASLVRAEAEAMRLAAEVRRERRRAAAAESDAAAAGKRRRDDVDGDGGKPVGGDPARAGLGVSGAGGIAAGVAIHGARDLPAPPPAPPVSLVLPPPPPAACAFPPDRSAGAAAGGAAAFAATVASAPAATRAILGFAASDFFFSATTRANDKDARERRFAVSTESDRVALAALRLRDVLSDLAGDAATAATFAAAAADLVVAAAAELEHIEAFGFDESGHPSRHPSPKAAEAEAFISPRAWFLRTAARDAMFALAACSQADVAAAEQIALLFGSATGASRGAAETAVLLAPRPPPEPLAGVPAAGTDGVGFLVPHPGVLGSRLVFSRVFAPAPPETAVDVVDDAVVGDGGDKQNEKLVEKLPRLGTRPKLNTSPFLDAALLILSSSLSSGDWYAARAALRLLSRAAAEADPLRGRGVFAAAAAAGHLARALGGDGETHSHRLNTHTIRGGGGTHEGASADRSLPQTTATSSHQRRRPPARVRRDALALARLLAGTPEFAACLDRGGAEGVSDRGDGTSLETTRETRLTKDATEPEAKKKRNKTFPNAAVDDVSGEKSKPFSDEFSDEEEPDCPLLRAVVACVEEFAEEARCSAEAEASASASASASDDAFAVEDELEPPPVCAYRSVGSVRRNENLNAALLTLAAISHAGWKGWGDAVRRHGVVAAAVAAAEAAFAAVANAPAASAADQRRVRHALMFVARLLAEPASARAASSALRRDGETCRRLARVARAANAHAEQMPRRVGKYLDSVLAAWS